MLRRGALFALCGVASTVVGLAALVLFGRSAPCSSESSTTRPASAIGTELDATGAPSTGSCIASDFAPGASRVQLPGSQRALRIALIEEGTRRPLPQAEVHVWHDPSGDRRCASWLCARIGPDFAAYIAEHGVAVVPDETGTVEVSRTDKTVYVAARFEGSFGLASFDTTDEDVQELILAPTHDVNIVVRDTDGILVAGIPVGLGECGDDDVSWSDVTDASGHCRIRDFETVAGDIGRDTSTPLAIRLALPSTPSIEKWIDPRRLPDSPVELVAPRTGTLRMRVVDARGRVVPVDGSVRVNLSEISSPNVVQPLVTCSTARVKLVAGRAVARVPIGQSLQIEADVPGTDDPSVEVIGPKSAGEWVDVEIPLVSEATLICCRAVDASGIPIANMPLRCSSLVDDGESIVDSQSELLTSDKDGRIAWTTKQSAPDGPRSARRTCHLCERSEGTIRRQATLVMPRELASEVIDLGDVTFTPSTPLVQGHAVDEAGHGVRHMIVEAVVLTSSSMSRRGADGYDPELDKVADDAHFELVWTRHDGGFAIFGPCLDLRWALRVRSGWNEPARIIPFACGTGSEPVQFIAPARCALSGTALVDHDWNGEYLNVRFVPAGGDQAGIRALSWRRVGERVLFRLEDAEPARGKIEFLGDASMVAVLEVPEIELVPGPEMHPRSLVDVDLRGKLSRRTMQVGTTPDDIELEIVDERGAPIPSGTAWVWRKEQDPAQVPWVAGHLRVHRDEVIRIEVWSPGMRFHVMTDPLDSHRIVLRPDFEVRIQCAVPQPLDGASIHVDGFVGLDDQAEPVEFPRALRYGTPFVPTADGRTCVHVAAPGQYSVSLDLSRRIAAPTEDDDGMRSADIRTWIEVRDVDGPQTISVEFDAEDVAAAMKDLGLLDE